MPPADDLEASVPLSAERIAAVKALFDAWDIDGSGSIDRRKLTGVSEVSFGPFHAQVFKQIEEMDADGDQLVTLEEMLSFFQVRITGGWIVSVRAMHDPLFMCFLHLLVGGRDSIGR